MIAKQQALFDRINLAEAWEITKGGPKVLVGVIDNRFDFFHPELKGQLIPGIYYSGGYHTPSSTRATSWTPKNFPIVCVVRWLRFQLNRRRCV